MDVTLAIKFNSEVKFRKFSNILLAGMVLQYKDSDEDTKKMLKDTARYILGVLVENGIDVSNSEFRTYAIYFS
jgi:hypothetical protein